MSFPIDLDSVTQEEKKEIVKKCTILSNIDLYTNVPKRLRLFSVDKQNKEINLPLALWEEFYENFPNNYENHVTLKDNTFKGSLRTNPPQDQTKVCQEALDTLKKKHSVLLALYTGFGKTVVSIWLLLKMKLKTIVVCPMRALHPQWKERIETFSNLKVQIVKTKRNPSADVYIMGAKKLANMKYSDFIDVGTVVVDEIEHICTTTFAVCLQRVRPQFLIGCSATPDRVDGLHKALDLYFPSPFLHRERTKDFTVIKYKTNFQPEIKSNRKGDLDWTHLQNSLSYNPQRHDFICELIEQYYDNHRIIVMVKRVNEIMDIYNKLKSKSISVDYVSQSKSSWDNTCTVLLGTYIKIGVGLDITDRNLTILAGDVKDIRQPEGRIRLSNNVIIDIVDDYSTLEKHWQQRRKWYLKRGASIKYDGHKKEEKVSEKREVWLLPDM